MVQSSNYELHSYRQRKNKYIIRNTQYHGQSKDKAIYISCQSRCFILLLSLRKLTMHNFRVIELPILGLTLNLLKKSMKTVFKKST